MNTDHRIPIKTGADPKFYGRVDRAWYTWDNRRD